MLENAIAVFNNFIIQTTNYLGLPLSEISHVKVFVVASAILIYAFIGWFINKYSDDKYYYPVISENIFFVSGVAIGIGALGFFGWLLISASGFVTLTEWLQVIAIGTFLAFITLYIRILKNTSFLFATFTYVYIASLSALTILFILLMMFSSNDDDDDY